MKIGRKEFLKCGCAVGIGCLMAKEAMYGLVGEALARANPAKASDLREAMFYEKLPGGMARCTLCPCSPITNNCGILSEAQVCVCHVRVNYGGKIYVTNYGKPCALHIDPVEKNPIYHMTPGKKSLALAAAGCNLECKCCQNWQMSQVGVDEIKSFRLSPSQVVANAKENRCSNIAYTFTEPAIFYEYMLDIAREAKKAGLRNCMVTGGYINEEPLRQLTPYIDTFSVSIKGFTEDYYKNYCRGRLETILNALRVLKRHNAWTEIVILVIPTLSDDLKQIGSMCQWILENMGPMTPLHFSRFWPSYKLKNLPQTPVSTLERARDTALSRGLKYVYIGNVPGHEGNNTFCHKCGKCIIQRISFKIIKNLVAGGKCPYCGTTIPGIWS